LLSALSFADDLPSAVRQTRYGYEDASLSVKARFRERERGGESANEKERMRNNKRGN